MAEIPFGDAIAKVIAWIFKAFLEILSFLFGVGSSNNITSRIRSQAKKQGRDDVVADIDAKSQKAKDTKERIDNFRKNL